MHWILTGSNFHLKNAAGSRTEMMGAHRLQRDAEKQEQLQLLLTKTHGLMLLSLVLPKGETWYVFKMWSEITERLRSAFTILIRFSYLHAEHDEPGLQTLQSCAPGSSAGLWGLRPCRGAPWCFPARCPKWRSQHHVLLELLPLAEDLHR